MKKRFFAVGLILFSCSVIILLTTFTSPRMVEIDEEFSFKSGLEFEDDDVYRKSTGKVIPYTEAELKASLNVPLNERKHATPPPVQNRGIKTTTSVPRKKKRRESFSTHGILNVHIWEGWCGSRIEDLKRNTHFPYYPSVRTNISQFFAQWFETGYGERIFGYLHPPETGNYSFAVSCDDNCEVWLSNSSSVDNLSKLVYVGTRDDPDNTDVGDFKKHSSQISGDIFLVKGEKYYVEALHKQAAFKDHILLTWLAPSWSRVKIISSAYISSYATIENITDVNEVTLYISETKLSSSQKHFNASGIASVYHFDRSKYKFGSDDARDTFHLLPMVDDLDGILPVIEYKPSYVVKFTPRRYEGVKLIHESSIFPNDHTELTHMADFENCAMPRELDSHLNKLHPNKTVPKPIQSFKMGSFAEKLRRKNVLLKYHIPLVYHQNLQSIGRKLLSVGERRINTNNRTNYTFKMKFFGDHSNRRNNKHFLKPRDLYARPPKIINKIFFRDGASQNISITNNRHMIRLYDIFGPAIHYLSKGVDRASKYVFSSALSSCKSDGNVLLSKEVAVAVVHKYMRAVEKKHNSKYSVKRVVNIEENHDVLKGDRYLIELELNVKGKAETYRHSKYIYQELSSQKLYEPLHFKWDPRVTVHVIVPVKDQGRWVKNFIRNMEQIYTQTKDSYLNIIIVDFSSADINITNMLKDSKLDRYEVVHLEGAFQRAYGIQVGADRVKNPDDIIFTCDLHLEIPSHLIDSIRKHTIKKKMAFAPMVHRLSCGYTPQLPYGSWEIQGYGLFAISKHDFQEIGGMNTKEFKTKWGGEDWELLDRVLGHGLEVERLRITKFFHYHHSKKRMWVTGNLPAFMNKRNVL